MICSVSVELFTNIKIFAFSLFLFGMTFGSGCTTSTESFPSGEQIYYFDRNGDGEIDQEKHKYPEWFDADWDLLDDDFDGNYEKKISYGFSLVETIVDLPVPIDVEIETQP